MLALEKPELVGDDSAFRIVLSADKHAGTLTVEDNGVGMDRDELVDNLGTIARSGTRAFVEGLSGGGEGSALIGQFGVGFYSAFMVASSVDVVSRRAGSETAWRWRSDGQGTYSVEPADPERAPARGTRVTLTLLDDARTYADQATLERVVAEYSAHVPVPIVLRVGDGVGEKTLADGSALWRKPKSSVTPAEYSRVLRPCQRPVRRAGADRPLPRRGAERVFGPPVRSLDQALRPVRSGAQEPHQALRPPRLHHRRGPDPSRLAPLRARRHRLGGPAAQPLARDAAEEPDPRSDRQGRHQPHPRRPRETRRRRPRALREDLGGVRAGDQGRPLRGHRAARRALQDRPLQDHHRRRCLAEPCRLRRRAPSEPDRHLLRARRRREIDPRQPASRRLRQARHRGAASLRSGRRVLGADRARLRRQALPVGDARRRRPCPHPARRRKPGRRGGVRRAPWRRSPPSSSRRSATR